MASITPKWFIFIYPKINENDDRYSRTGDEKLTPGDNDAILRATIDQFRNYGGDPLLPILLFAKKFYGLIKLVA